MDPKFSLLEAAPVLGVSPHTLRLWARQGRIAFHRLGRRLVFSEVDLQEFLRRNRVPAREEARR